MAIFLLSSRLPLPSTRETLRGYLLPSCERSLSVRITRVKQANKVHLLSTLNAQQLRSDGNRSKREHSATLPAGRHSQPALTVSWAPTAALWAGETKSDAYVPHTNKAKPKPGSAAALTLQSPAAAQRAHRAATRGLGGNRAAESDSPLRAHSTAVAGAH